MKYTYKFKLYHYHDGDGKDVFRAAEHIGLGIYLWVRYTGYKEEIRTWYTREGAVDHITTVVKNREENEKLNAAIRKSKKLSLVIVEKIEI